MTIDEFKNKYLKNAFFWVNEDNYMKIQEIMMACEIYNHTDNPEPIEWHEGFKNLVVFEPDKFNNRRYYQKVDLWLPNAMYGEPKNVKEFLDDWETVKDKIDNNKK